MKISVHNYGPIAKAEDVELLPLTVFIGPSNTGKSYLAMLVYSLFLSFREASSFNRYSRKKPSHKKLMKEIKTIMESEKKLMAHLYKWESVPLSELPEKFLRQITPEIANQFSDYFFKNISDCIGLPPDKNSLFSDSFKLKWEDNQKNLTLKPKASPRLSLDAKQINFGGDKFRFFSEITKVILSQEKKSQKDKKKEMGLEAFFLYSKWLDCISEGVFTSQGKINPFYLPAARTWIMQSHQVIAEALIGRSSSAGLESVSISKLSGVLSDFLKGIIFIETDKVLNPDIGKIAHKMEKEALDGSIILKFSEVGHYPQFSYKQKKVQIPLSQSSSMISELAPIVLFLKYKVNKGDLLIIEEPEAHLHPEAQTSIAKTVVRLIRAGVRVMITTHSSYFLDQLAYYILQSKLIGDKSSKAKRHSHPLFLKEEETGAYVFKRSEQGTVVERLPFDHESGFSSEDHLKVDSELYNKTVKAMVKVEKKKAK